MNKKSTGKSQLITRLSTDLCLGPITVFCQCPNVREVQTAIASGTVELLPRLDGKTSSLGKPKTSLFVHMATPQLMLVPPIYVDLDDVLAETLRAFSKLVKRMYGRDVPFEKIHSFDLSASFGLTANELRQFMHVAHSPGILLDDVVPVPGALESLNLWREAGAHITVVTGRPVSTYETTREWLHRYEVPYHVLRFVRKYGRNDLDPSARQPLDIRTLYKASFAFVVEDSPKMATFLIKRLGMPVVLLSKPWNAESLDVEESQLLVRCKSWGHAREIGLRLLLQGNAKKVAA